MRQYKYRGKATCSDRWVFGCYVECDGGYYIVEKLGGHEGDVAKIQVILATVGQSTGLKDKNGLEIDWWENDLLQSLGTNKKIGQIKYDEKCAEWRLYVDGNSWCSLVAAYYDGWKKVGNIHQNPELMETKNEVM